MKPQRVRWTPPKQVTYDLFYFTVNVTDDGAIAVQPVPDRPAESTEANESLLMLAFDPSGQNGLGLSLTWLSGKPAPESELRKRGLLAVLTDIRQRLSDEEGRKLLDNLTLGLGHAYGARVEIHERDNDERQD